MENTYTNKLVVSIIDNQCFLAKGQAEQFIQDLYDVLFQIGDVRIENRQDFNKTFSDLEEYFDEILSFVIDSEKRKQKIKETFFEAIPRVYETLKSDSEFILKGDPAAQSVREIQIAYPGFFATAVYRFSNILYEEKVPILPRILSEYARSKTGVDIHPGATIGKQFMIDHGTGVVIGETTSIGKQVKIFQGVTLGALSVSRDGKDTKRHPTIKDNVVIYSGATILGGETIIGENSIIGGNVWLTNSVEPDSKVFHKSQIIVKGKKVKQEPINFVI